MTAYPCYLLLFFFNVSEKVFTGVCWFNNPDCSLHLISVEDHFLTVSYTKNTNTVYKRGGNFLFLLQDIIIDIHIN